MGSRACRLAQARTGRHEDEGDGKARYAREVTGKTRRIVYPQVTESVNAVGIFSMKIRRFVEIAVVREVFGAGKMLLILSGQTKRYESPVKAK